MSAQQKKPPFVHGQPSMGLPFQKELVVDLFAGGGGASTGIARAYREPDVAVNHNPIALAVHRANHPKTAHYVADVFEVDPVMATGGQPVGILWASPDCRHHSKAKGGAPRDRGVRGLAWVVVRWAHATRPRLMFLENVEEFCDWGPIDEDGQPIKVERGRTFKSFIAALSTGLPADHPDMPEVLQSIGDFVPVESLVRGLGYNVEWRERIAANAGAPTIRKRLYLVARSDGLPIVWPEPVRHKKPTAKQQPWRTAAECIDWSNLGKTIFRDKPMALNTRRRVAKGMWRHVITSDKPFIVPLRGTSSSHTSTHSVDEAVSTISSGGTHHALVQPVAAPFLTECANGSSQRNFDVQEPLRTQVAQVKGGHFAMAACHLTHLTHHGERSGYSPDEAARTVTGANRGEQVIVCGHMTAFGQNAVGSTPDDPAQTVLAGAARHGVVAAFFEQANGGFYKGDGRPADAPMSTICQSGSNQRLVNAYLVKYYGCDTGGVSLTEPMHTLPTKDRVALVEVVRVPDTLTLEQIEGARRCAAFMHEHLPQHFKEPAEMIMIGGYVLVDITLRMLQPPELKAAQGFDKDYIIDRGLFVDPVTGAEQWLPINKTNQVRLIGNSVCPDEAEALVRANAADIIELYQRLAA
ncbi:DNA cytosine methyltransferase [Pseudomonas fluorescens group sp.]|uniref:DNA (cytosine-5-)-methyltransferase n=2 Tax=Pseudomonas fluorescens TaxID=294 RepID=C3KA07_PSEFS|nr:DNA cytosine methyltransferase [Pseudomonas fluorescens group sp.]MBZ6459857.1 DNA cytosine methyltransferase [Pseudomonas fluorescens group sp.]MBZ6466748.1 DNA cytosine methyltransferase [Pseudomonas fluorescens group sp.]CAI2797053.1 DNA (cytosine-5-)-methyltransferase (EC [Pseudomonas fluorescens SBW25]